jgi:chromosome segregation ATPase
LCRLNISLQAVEQDYEDRLAAAQVDARLVEQARARITEAEEAVAAEERRRAEAEEQLKQSRAREEQCRKEEEALERQVLTVEGALAGAAAREQALLHRSAGLQEHNAILGELVAALEAERTSAPLASEDIRTAASPLHSSPDHSHSSRLASLECVPALNWNCARFVFPPPTPCCCCPSRRHFYLSR